MGLLFNNAATLKICSKLNRRFSEEKLEDIRTNQARKDRFDPSKRRTLERVAYKSGLWPGRGQAGEKAKRWYKFLFDMRAASPTTHDAIRQALWDGINDSNVVAITFVALESPDAQYRFTPSAISVVDPANPSINKEILVMVLQTPALGAGAGAVPPRDTDEPVGEIQDPDPSGIEDPMPAPALAGRKYRPAPKKKAAAKKKVAAKAARKKKA